MVGVRQGEDGPDVVGGEDLAHAFGRRWPTLLSSLNVTGRRGEVASVPTLGVLPTPLLVFVGLGTSSDKPRVDASSLRFAAGTAARATGTAGHVALALPADTPASIAAIVEGHVGGGYTFTEYKTSPASSGADDVEILTPIARQREALLALDQALVLANAITVTRDWVNTPPGDFTPPVFADTVVEAVAQVRGVRVKVFDERDLAAMKCGGILAVGAGSAAPPRLVELTYAPRGASTHIALVGKGITFDSGGLTIKPGSSMATMKDDMHGAASIINATLAIAALGLPVKVTAFAAMAENMVGAASFRPGDVVTHYDGTTTEVTNTDAEGRMVLADALARAAEKKPDVIVEVSTLTGPMVVALGDKITGVLGSEEVVADILAAAELAGEDMWPMPIPEIMDERVHSSKIADRTQSDWVRWGGGLFAARFLQDFVGDVPWAHLDIAGPCYNTGGPVGHITSGATGVAVSTLVGFARSVV